MSGRLEHFYRYRVISIVDPWIDRFNHRRMIRGERLKNDDVMG